MKKTWVIKAGGEFLADQNTREKILSDLAKRKKSNPIVFVHGGGPQINAELTKYHVMIERKNGRRITSDETMVVVERVLSGLVNKSVVADLGTKGVKAVGLSGRDAKLITAELLFNLDRTGQPKIVNNEILVTLCKNGFLPVCSSVASDKKGKPVNVNADDFASALACSLKASHLVFLTDISGVQDKNKNRIPVLRASEIDDFIEDQTITGGMIPKVQSARNAILKGVGEVDIVNGHQGIDLNAGTRIVK